MKKNMIFWGGTGHSLVLEEIISNDFNVLAVFDNNPSVVTPFDNVKIYYGRESFESWFPKYSSDLFFSVAIGGKYGKDRIEISNYLKSFNLKPINIIHKTSVIGKGVEVGEGCHILANTLIGVKTTLGNQVIINNSANVDHECQIGNGVHIGPGAVLAGCIQVGDFAFVGAGATILPRIKIGENSIVGAGAVVTKDVPENSIVVGNPAKSR
jgi:sugar O-acyltransferase (sialic acid O-acetyltransferase NeuD family)